ALRVTVLQRPRSEVGAQEFAERAIAHGRRRHREIPRGDALAQTEQVRTQTALLRREERARAAEAGGDLVANEQDAMGTTCFAEAGEAVDVRELHAGRALHEWFDDDGRDLSGVRGDHLCGDVEALRITEMRCP